MDDFGILVKELGERKGERSGCLGPEFREQKPIVSSP